uniref:Enkurin domain containing 1 n=1 Tax=Nothobranchius furzeri TaxID=105023 RepID=A0A8C6NX75_NOTFU
MCEGPSTLSGPIPPDPSLCPQFYRRPSSARGRLEGNHDKPLALFLGPLAPDPVLYPDCYSAHTLIQRPRINPNATHILEHGRKGLVGELLKLDGVSVTPVPKQSEKNVRRLREIQKRCKEQEAERAQSGPVPVKALWTSSKYQNTPSKVMAHLEYSHPIPSSQIFFFHPSCGSFCPSHYHGEQSFQPLCSPSLELTSPRHQEHRQIYPFQNKTQNTHV